MHENEIGILPSATRVQERLGGILRLVGAAKIRCGQLHDPLNAETNHTAPDVFPRLEIPDIFLTTRGFFV